MREKLTPLMLLVKPKPIQENLSQSEKRLSSKEPMKTSDTVTLWRENANDHVAIGFSFPSDWLRG